jgi:antitoxin (DNA-binding transcriptional repressor) of toxin-antitoxin stability system
MRTTKLLAVCLLCSGLTWAGSARAYDLVRVVSGNEIQVTNAGRPMSLIVSGITVPAPPTANSAGEYRGAEARQFLIAVFKAQTAFIKEIEPVRPDAKTVRVRIRVGEEGERDLAVLMAEAGLALTDKTAPHEDPEFIAAVRDGERQARVAHRGMHDGGYTAFMNGQGHEVDLGVGTLSGEPPPEGYLAYLYDLANMRNAQATAKYTKRTDIHSSGTNAIRDWGSAMGLPPDSADWGH